MVANDKIQKYFYPDCLIDTAGLLDTWHLNIQRNLVKSLGSNQKSNSTSSVQFQGIFYKILIHLNQEATKKLVKSRLIAINRRVLD